MTHLWFAEPEACSEEHFMSRIPLVAVPIVIAALAFAACGGSISVGGSSISKDEIAKQASASLEQSVGSKPPPITCPEDLAATVGETTTCVMQGTDGDYNVAVTITKVDGTNATFDVQVADTPN